MADLSREWSLAVPEIISQEPNKVISKDIDSFEDLPPPLSTEEFSLDHQGVSLHEETIMTHEVFSKDFSRDEELEQKWAQMPDEADLEFPSDSHNESSFSSFTQNEIPTPSSSYFNIPTDYQSLEDELDLWKPDYSEKMPISDKGIKNDVHTSHQFQNIENSEETLPDKIVEHFSVTKHNDLSHEVIRDEIRRYLNSSQGQEWFQNQLKELFIHQVKEVAWAVIPEMAEDIIKQEVKMMTSDDA